MTSLAFAFVSSSHPAASVSPGEDQPTAWPPPSQAAAAGAWDLASPGASYRCQQHPMEQTGAADTQGRRGSRRRTDSSQNVKAPRDLRLCHPKWPSTPLHWLKNGWPAQKHVTLYLPFLLPTSLPSPPLSCCPSLAPQYVRFTSTVLAEVS